MVHHKVSANRSLDRRSPERLNQFVADALMVPLAVVVGHEVGNGAPKVAFTERDHAIEALLLDRSHEALRVGVTAAELHFRSRSQISTRPRPRTPSMSSVR